MTSPLRVSTLHKDQSFFSNRKMSNTNQNPIYNHTSDFNSIKKSTLIENYLNGSTKLPGLKAEIM